MRQIGDEYRFDPFLPMTTQSVENKSLGAKQQVEHQAFLKNTVAERAHKYCTAKVINLGNNQFSDAEAQGFSNCLNQYTQAFGIFKQERNSFLRNIAEMRARGEDIFAEIDQASVE